MRGVQRSSWKGEPVEKDLLHKLCTSFHVRSKLLTWITVQSSPTAEKLSFRNCTLPDRNIADVETLNPKLQIPKP